MLKDLRRHIMGQQRGAYDYVQDDLLFWLDCDDFVQGQTWTDRVAGINFNMPATGVTKNADGSAAFDGATRVSSDGAISQTPTDCCVEIVMNNKNTGQNYGIIGGSNSSLRFWYYSGGILLSPMQGGFPHQNTLLIYGNTKNVIQSTFGVVSGKTFSYLLNNSFNTIGVSVVDFYNINVNMVLGDVGTRGYYWTGDLYCVRYYNRALTMMEREHNLAIDRQRFNLV